jgi:hypothetical protein
MSLIRRGTRAPALLAAVVLAAGAVLAQPALALSLETAPANPDGSVKFGDQGQKLDRYNDRSLSDRNDLQSDRDNQPRGLTFGSPETGQFSFTVGPGRTADPFNNSRFFRLGPPGGQ